MRASERGFTLVEMLVAAGILAVILVAGGVWLLGMRPGALAQALDDYDAAVASARGIAANSGNGATLVFAPRADGGKTLPGFELRVYSGRPTAKNAVMTTTVMPVVSNASISEKTLGSPAFAIFLGASGDVSGEASYPTIDSAGAASFAVIATEPTCPRGGFVLTFTGPQKATATRSLPCVTSVASSPGVPNPSPTPNGPLVTPPALVYHWPADAVQSFVATEWGYTHWFATTNGFACGAGVATFPNVLPSPYSPAYSRAEADASPAPPSKTPYSYPNSDGESMNDAPATFPLNPTTEGLCDATVTDDYGQSAHTSVQVMGWLTAAYNATAYTHLSPSPIALPASAFAAKGSSVTIELSKTYDSEQLQPQVTLDASCSPYVTISTASETPPSSPSKTPAKAGITLRLATMPQSKTPCSGIIYDQYPGSKTGEDIPFNFTLQPAVATTWPPAVKYPLPGMSIDKCAKNQPQAYTGKDFATIDKNDRDPFGAGLTTDADGCMFNPSGAKVSMASNASILVNEPGYTGNFAYLKNSQRSCGTVLAVGWSVQNGPTGRFVMEGLSPTTEACPIELTDSTGEANPDGTNVTYVEVSSACGSICYALIEVSKIAEVIGCAIGEEGCQGVELGQDANQLEEWYESSDGGMTWTIVGSCGQTLRYAEIEKGNSGWTEVTIDLSGCTEGTAKPNLTSQGSATPAPTPWIPSNISWTYSDNEQYPCIYTGGGGSCPTPPPNVPPAWAPTAPPGSTGLVIPYVPDPGALMP